MKETLKKVAKWAALFLLFFFALIAFINQSYQERLMIAGFGIVMYFGWSMYKEIARSLDATHKRLDLLVDRVTSLEAVAHEARAEARSANNSVDGMVELLEKKKPSV